MHGSLESGWELAVYAAIAVVLLLLGTFRLEGILARKKRKKGPQLVVGRRLQHPGKRLMDPHGRGTSKTPASIERSMRRRPRVIP